MSEETGFQYTDEAIPRAYDEILVPRMFGPLAELLLNECDPDRGAVVLDVASGTGIVPAARPCLSNIAIVLPVS